MKRDIILTADGSHSLSVPEMGVTYHSIHGAIQESMHVYIEAGLRHAWKNYAPSGNLHIVEIGWGTGLNALLSLVAAENEQRRISYEAIEPFPVDPAIAASLNYCTQLRRPDLQTAFLQMHTTSQGEEIAVSPRFYFTRIDSLLADFSTAAPVQLVYFDAFAPGAQPELWTVDSFKRMHDMMASGALLVTYCSKSIVRRAMQEAGFRVEKIPGPAHKREMLRAVKGQ